MPGAIKSPSAQNGVAAFGFFDGNGAQAIEAGGKGAGEELRHVLHDDDTGRIRRQRLEEYLQRLGAPGGCADHDDFLGRLRHSAGGRGQNGIRR